MLRYKLLSRPFSLLPDYTASPLYHYGAANLFCLEIVFLCFCRRLSSLFYIYSCFEIGCLTNGEKPTWQCRKLLWVMVVFTVAWVNLKVFQRGGKKQHKHQYSCFLLVLVAKITLKLNQATLTTHNTNWHCRVRFSHFCGTTFVETVVYFCGPGCSKAD